MTHPERFRRALGEWFDREQRALPWRVEPRVLYWSVVSELMLQQTQIATALPYFGRWMQLLPDFATLAAADEAVVLKLWEGLGYYRRARFLHRLARELVRMPEPPRTAAAWRELPGVGPYTAAAVASMVFGDPVACVDGNVVRILARLTGETRAFANGSQAVKHFQPLAQQLVDATHPGRHNEAMMELGAIVCTRGSPKCERCPVVTWCEARRSRMVSEIPRIARPATERLAVDRVWMTRGKSLLLHRASAGATRMSGLWELPTATSVGLSTAALSGATTIGTIKRAITRHQITETILAVEAGALGRGRLPEDVRWIALDQIATLTFSGPHRRWLTKHLAEVGAPIAHARVSSPETASTRRRRSG